MILRTCRDPWITDALYSRWHSMYIWWIVCNCFIILILLTHMLWEFFCNILLSFKEMFICVNALIHSKLSDWGHPCIQYSERLSMGNFIFCGTFILQYPYHKQHVWSEMHISFVPFSADYTHLLLTCPNWSSGVDTVLDVLQRLTCLDISLLLAASGPRFNIKMSSCRYRKSHCGDV